MFDNCNSTLANSISESCQVIEVHTQCYNDIATSCDATELGQLGPILDQVDAEIRAASPTGCVPPLATTTVPSPISACEIMFNNCNSTLSNSIKEPCLIIEVHTQCYNDIATACESVELANLGQYLDQVDTSIRSNSPIGCIPTTSLEPTTTTLSSTTVYNVQYCFEQVTKCSQLSDLAEVEPDLQKACGFKTLYVECLKDNTTACDQASQADISNIIVTTENKYNQSPYLCNQVLKTTTDTITTTKTTATSMEAHAFSTTRSNEAISTITKPAEASSTTTKPTTVVTISTTSIYKPMATKVQTTSGASVDTSTTEQLISTTSPKTSKQSTSRTKSEPTITASTVSEDITTLKTSNFVSTSTVNTGTISTTTGATTMSVSPTDTTATRRVSTITTATSKVPVSSTKSHTSSGQSTVKDAESPQKSTTPVPGPPSIFPPCAKEADICSETLTVKINTGMDVPKTCLAVDESLGCVAAAAANCDPVSTAEVASILLLVINQFKNDPYSCNLTNADNHIFHLGNCITALEHCTDILEQANTQADFNQACVLKDNYKECLAVNTTSCDATVQADIANKIKEADFKFNQATHFCDERQSNELAFVQGCDNETAVCFAILAQIGHTVFLPDDICETKTDFMDCMVNIKCPPQMRAYLEDRAVNISSDFDHKPYFCSSTNRCLDIFTDCNKTIVEQNKITDPCELPQMHQMCLQSIKLGCDVQQWDNLSASVGVEDAAIKNTSPTRCGELTSSTPSSLTTLSEKTTVEGETTATTQPKSSETTSKTTDKSTPIVKTSSSASSTSKATIPTKANRNTTVISIVMKTTPRKQRTTPKYYIHQPTPGHIQQQWHYRHSSADSIRVTFCTLLLPIFLPNLYYI